MNPISEEAHLPIKAPPLDEEQQQLNAALAMQAIADGIPVQVRPEINMDNEPRSANDLQEKAKGRAICLGAATTQGRLILESLGIPPAAVSADLARHDELWSTYQDTKVVRRGARDGRRISDRFRQVAAAMVDIESAALLDETQDGKQKSALISDLRDIHGARLDRIKDQKGAQQQVEKIEEAARARIADVEARQKLQDAMSAMRQGEELPWDQVIEAVDTYRAFYGDDHDDDALSDRRDRDRVH